MPENKCVVIKLPKAVENNSLRKLNEIKIGILGKGNHTSYSYMWLRSKTLPFTMKAYGDVRIYTNSSLATPLTELVIDGNANTQVFFTCATNGAFGILNGLNIPFSDFNPLTAVSSTLSPVIQSDITHFNFMNVESLNLTGSLISGNIKTNIENMLRIMCPQSVNLELLHSPILRVLIAPEAVQSGLTTNQLVTLFPALREVDLYNTGLTGNISEFSVLPMLYSLFLSKNSGLTIDLATISSFALSAVYFGLYEMAGLTFTGTTTQFSGRTFEYLVANGTSFNSATLSTLLVALSGASWVNGGSLYLMGDVANITAPAVTAIATIQGYGVSVGITQG